MKRLAYLAIIFIAISGCHRAVAPAGSVYGKWYSKSVKNINSNIVAKITQQEQFYQNGTLISTKWFSLKDHSGVNLGEFYITKQFKFTKKSKAIKAKFIRCSTGVTKQLKVHTSLYNELSRRCKYQIGGGRVTSKFYNVLGSRLQLGRKVYYRE